MKINHNGSAAAGSRPNCRRAARQYVLITGGAGFIGTNLADRLLERGERVLIFDNLSRKGVANNLRRLCRKHRGANRPRVIIGDVRDRGSVRRAVRSAGHVFHLAAQVAVTTSLDEPVHDFEVNACGTLNLLDAIRQRHDPPPLLFTSTNKVYGALPDVRLAISDDGSRYEPADDQTRERGISERRHLDFCSPYGCSKGAADQLVRDFARSYGLATTVFRMSCIYGPHQCGNEDQGWIAHFLLRALQGKPITIYGDGRQVRDVLYVDDLIDAMLSVRAGGERLSGEVFNVGGGAQHAVSLLDLIRIIEQLQERPVNYTCQPWRVGDQRYYTSDIERIHQMIGWSPRIGVREGVARLRDWLRASRKGSSLRSGLRHMKASETAGCTGH